MATQSHTQINPLSPRTSHTLVAVPFGNIIPPHHSHASRPVSALLRENTPPATHRRQQESLNIAYKKNTIGFVNFCIIANSTLENRIEVGRSSQEMVEMRMSWTRAGAVTVRIHLFGLDTSAMVFRTSLKSSQQSGYQSSLCNVLKLGWEYMLVKIYARPKLYVYDVNELNQKCGQNH